jgi:hypothetical protein
MTSSPSASLGFTWVRIMNSYGYHKMKKSPKENDTQFNQKIHAHDRLESARRFRPIKVLEKGRKFNTGYYIAEVLKPLSQQRSVEAAGKERKLLVHANNSRIPPSYQLNILTRIE